MKNIWIFIFILFFCLTPAVSQAIIFEASIGIWNQDPQGYVGYDPKSNIDRLDIENDLKYDRETEVFGRLKVSFPLVLPDFYIIATPIKFEEKGQKNVQFNFGDKSFNQDVPFTSKIQLDHYDIALFYSIPFLKLASLGKLNAEIGINARIIDFEAEVRQSQSGVMVSSSKSITLPVPMVYVGAQIKPISYISIEFEGRGIAYSSNHYYDVIGRLKIKPVKKIFIAGGYRYEDFKIDYRDILSKIKIKGPFLEGGIEF